MPLSALAHLVPVEVHDSPRDRVLSAIVGALRESGANDRLLVCVDDAHLLDDASATLVQLLARKGGPSVLLAVRSDEPTPDAIVGLWKDGLAPRLELQALSEVEVADLTTSMLGGPVDRAALRLLWESTRGNVLFLRVLVNEGLASGALTDAGGFWQWRGPATVGPSLREIIAARLTRLDDEARAAMEAIAIAEPVGVSVLGDLVAPEILEGLEREGLVEVRREGARRVVRAGHPLYGEVIRAATPVGRADKLRLAIAEAIEATGMRRVDDVLRVGVLRVDGGAPPRPELLLRGARRAWTLHDTALVERLAGAALAAGPDPAASYLLGETMADRGRYDEAIACWEDVLEGDCDDTLRSQIAGAAAAVLALTKNRPDDAQALIVRALDRMTSEGGRSRLAAMRAMLFVHAAPAAELHTTTSALLGAAETSDEAQVWAWIASARLRMTAGDLESVLADSDRIEEFAQRARNNWPLSTLFVSLCRYFALLTIGRLDDAERLSNDQLEVALGDPLPFIRGYWSEGLGLVALARGHLDEADRHLSEVVALFREHDNGTLRLSLYELAMVRALRGDADGATAALEEAATANQGIIEPFVTPERVRAAIAAATGNASAARALVAQHAQWARDANQPFFEVPALHDLARHGGARDAVDRLEELAECFDGVPVQLFALQARALVSGDGHALLAIAERCALVGLDLDAAESAVAAASAFRVAGDRTRATAANRRSAELLIGCGRPRTFLLSDREELAVLSEREREVAALAVSGMSDPEIAAQLYLSVRTVNAHLRSVYMKLGISGRRNLSGRLDGS